MQIVFTAFFLLFYCRFLMLECLKTHYFFIVAALIPVFFSNALFNSGLHEAPPSEKY